MQSQPINLTCQVLFSGKPGSELDEEYRGVQIKDRPPVMSSFKESASVYVWFAIYTSIMHASIYVGH